MNLRLILRFVFGVMLLAAAWPAASAQVPGNPNRVTFYTEPNFRGEAVAVEAGATVPDLGQILRPSQKPWIFAISSVQVEGDARATVYTAPNFQGERLEITRSIADLYAAPRSGGTWDRSIASLQVAGTAVAPAPTLPPPVVVPDQRPPTVVVVPRGPPPPPPPVRVVRPVDLRAVDAAIHRAFREVLNRPADPEGLRTYRHRIINEGWTEAQVITQLQRSTEARAVNADEAIRKAYREVLGRDPDANGLAHYRAKWREGWTQGQIRDDLRRSVEGRGNHIQAAITRAYRDLLGRDPDPGGYANFERLMREKGYTERDVRTAIMASEEYRQRRGRR